MPRKKKTWSNYYLKPPSKKANLSRALSEIENSLKHGANPNIKGRWVTEPIKSTPLMWAVKVGNIQLVKLLIKYGANPLSKDSRGKTLFDKFYIPKGINDDVQKTKKYRKIVKTIKIIRIQRKWKESKRRKALQNRKKWVKKVLLAWESKHRKKIPKDVIDEITRKYLFNMNVPPPVPLRRQKAREHALGGGSLHDEGAARCDYRYLSDELKVHIPKNSVNKYCKQFGYAECDIPRKRKSRKRYCSHKKRRSPKKKRRSPKKKRRSPKKNSKFKMGQGLARKRRSLTKEDIVKFNQYKRKQMMHKRKSQGHARRGWWSRLGLVPKSPKNNFKI